MNAAGVLGMSASILKRVYDGGAGAVVTKSLGSIPRVGHSNPTLITIKGGVLNAMGLPNPGAENFFETIKELKSSGVPVIASFFGASIEEFREVACILSDAGADALELNCSCPNVEDEIGMLGADRVNTKTVTAAVKEVVEPPVFVKLSPNVTDITEIARAAEKGGADAITATNTLKGLVVNIETKRPFLSNVTGGLSGPALKPVALRCVWEISDTVEIPVIGCGGVTNWRDVVEYMLCGASAVQVGTAVMDRGINVYGEIADGVLRYLKKNGFKTIKDIIGLTKET
jgi:dihydroorotate dehydrogenase (NAD+) catalytic subunit